MRPIITSVLALSILASSQLVFAQETTATTVPTPGGTTSTSVTTGVVAPATPAAAPADITSTTTTTQAGIDVPPPAPRTEAGGETKTSWVNRPLLATGLVLFGGTYAASDIVAAESANAKDRPNLYYPVAGPWMDLAQRGGGAGDKVLLAFDGVGQGLGALAIVSSLFIPESTRRSWFIIGSGDKVQVAPTSVASGYGIGAAGRF